MTGVNGLWELWKTVCVFQAVVGAFFSVHNGGRFHRRCARVTKVTDDIGRFDDESR